MIWIFIKTCDGGAEQSAIAREMLYTALSEKFALPMIEIKKTAEGKPYFEDKRYPAFSISHTEGAICVAISDSAESVGVDIEKYSDRLQSNRLTDRFFPSLTVGENEISDIEIMTAEDTRIEENTDIVFTLGEAIIKCDGRGFAAAREAQALSEKMRSASFKLTAKGKTYALSVAIKEKE
jgi:phosphopantetheinyl transferase